MHRLLRYIPKRFHVFVMEYLGLVVAGLVCLIGFVAWFLFFSVTPHRHDGYLRFPVLRAMDATDEYLGFKARFFFEPEPGRVVFVTTRSLVVAGQITSNVCVERRLEEDGRTIYRMAPQDACRD